MEGTEDLYPEELSGGMKKRVAIARAISFKPDIILYDEPTTGLDGINAANILELIKKTQEKKKCNLGCCIAYSEGRNCCWVIALRFSKTPKWLNRVRWKNC